MKNFLIMLVVALAVLLWMNNSARGRELYDWLESMGWFNLKHAVSG